MNAEAVKQMLVGMVPFVRTVGITIDEVGKGTASATLPARKEVNNHLGTAHAGAVYTLGETATGAVVLSMFADLLPNAFIALKSASVAHTKARPGDVVATAKVVGDGAAIRASYDEAGKADFDVAVEFVADGVMVATVTYTWAVRAPRS